MYRMNVECSSPSGFLLRLLRGSEEAMIRVNRFVSIRSRNTKF